MELTGTTVRYRMRVEYDGTDFHGWQWQPNLRTVQDTLQQAVSKILSRNITIIGSGRTDAGVHSLGQVAHFHTIAHNITCEHLQLGLNSILPRDVRVYELQETDPNFHARFDAKLRTYEYRVDHQFHPLRRTYCWVPKYRWNNELIASLCQIFRGRHSFKSYCKSRPEEKTYRCDVQLIEWETDQSGATLRISADRFLRGMVRSITGALIHAGRGHYSLEHLQMLLEKPERNAQVFIAPPQGLTLVEVLY